MSDRDNLDHELTSDGAEIEQAWEALAEERYRRYLAGEEEAIPAGKALAEIRADLGLQPDR
jgi:hypothetical protein